MTVPAKLVGLIAQPGRWSGVLSAQLEAFHYRSSAAMTP